MFREISVKDFDIHQFETKQVFYSSKDDTKVPMFIVQKKVGLLLKCQSSIHHGNTAKLMGIWCLDMYK